jgi:hypothetical protein
MEEVSGPGISCARHARAAELAEAPAEGRAASARPTGPAEEPSVREELRALGWMPLIEHAQPDAELQAWLERAPQHSAAVRLADGLVLRRPSATQLLASVRAVNTAARRGTTHPRWLAEGLTLDANKRVCWPEPETPSGASCAHEATPSAPYTCVHCGAALPRDFYEAKAAGGAEVGNV